MESVAPSRAATTQKTKLKIDTTTATMTKNNAKKRKHALFHATRRTVDHDEIADANVVTDSDLEKAVSTIHAVAANPSLFYSRRCKDLRRALHPLVLEQMQSYDKGTDFRIKVTQALTNQKWADAIAALQGCRDFRQVPKQGTVQRWVRDCDAAPASCKITLLAAVLNISGGENSDNKHDAGQVLADQVGNCNQELTILEGWQWPHVLPTFMENDNDSDTSHPSNNIVTKQSNDTPWVNLDSRIIYREDAIDRKPPNKHDLLLHTSAANSIQWSTSPFPVVNFPVPFVEGAFVLDHVLTANECQQLRTAATQLGFRPDHPVHLDKPTGIDSCEWLVDDSIMSVVYKRVQGHLPKRMGNSDKTSLHSINSRWRFFRYDQDCVYRPHIDGSWPESRIVDGEYKCDESGMVKSYLTFLMYLNDDFQGGETRFYFPSGNGMAARGVIPKQGAVLVFPQGNTASLIHEGSAVTEGTKFVVRTDVLYRVEE